MAYFIDMYSVSKLYIMSKKQGIKERYLAQDFIPRSYFLYYDNYYNIVSMV